MRWKDGKQMRPRCHVCWNLAGVCACASIEAFLESGRQTFDARLMSEADRIWHDARRGLSEEQIANIQQSGRQWGSRGMAFPRLIDYFIQQTEAEFKQRLSEDADRLFWSGEGEPRELTGLASIVGGETTPIPTYDPVAEAEKIIYFEGES
jgi:hypothetical protein